MYPTTVNILCITIPFYPGAVYCDALSNSSINFNDIDLYKYF